MKKEITIAIQVETNRAHGRSMIEGIADYALAHTDWRLESIDPKTLADPANFRRFDGFIVRVMDDATADAVSWEPTITTGTPSKPGTPE